MITLTGISSSKRRKVNVANDFRVEAEKLLGNALDTSTSPSSNYLLSFNGTNWTYTNAPTLGNTTVNTLVANAINSGKSDPVMTLAETGDTQSRYILENTGAMEWGTGSGTQDVKLSRSGVSVLQIDNNNNAGIATLAIDGITTVQTNGNLSIGGNGSGYVLANANGIQFTNSTTGYTGASLTYFESGTTHTFTTGGAMAVSMTLTFTRIGNIVIMYWGDTSGSTTSAAAITIPASAVPTRFCPTAQKNFCYQCNNGGVQGAIASVGSNGSGNFWGTISEGNFSNSITATIYSGTAVWSTT